ALGVSLRLSIIHFIISAASTAMIVHVMLIDKKFEATLWAIDLLKHIRGYASALVLACAAVYLWNTLGMPAFQRRAARSEARPSLLLGSERENARFKSHGLFGYGQKRNTTPPPSRTSVLRQSKQTARSSRRFRESILPSQSTVPAKPVF